MNKLEVNEERVRYAPTMEQEFKNNLDEICKPSVTKCKNKPYTKITFKR